MIGNTHRLNQPLLGIEKSTNCELKGQIRAQNELPDSLLCNLDLAFSFLETSRIERTDDPEYCRRAAHKANETLRIVRKLEGHIEDPEAGRAIHSRAAELERALASFPETLAPAKER